MRPNIQPLIEERFAVELGGLLEVRRELLVEKMIMVDPGLSGRFVSGEGVVAQHNIAASNARLLAPGRVITPIELASFGLSGTAPFSANKAIRFRSAILESAAVLDAKVLPTKGFVVLRDSRTALGELSLFSDTALRAGRSSDGIDWKLLGEYSKD